MQYVDEKEIFRNCLTWQPKITHRIMCGKSVICSEPTNLPRNGARVEKGNLAFLILIAMFISKTSGQKINLVWYVVFGLIVVFPTLITGVKVKTRREWMKPKFICRPLRSAATAQVPELSLYMGLLSILVMRKLATKLATKISNRIGSTTFHWVFWMVCSIMLLLPATVLGGRTVGAVETQAMERSKLYNPKGKVDVDFVNAGLVSTAREVDVQIELVKKLINEPENFQNISTSITTTMEMVEGLISSIDSHAENAKKQNLSLKSFTSDLTLVEQRLEYLVAHLEHGENKTGEHSQLFHYHNETLTSHSKKIADLENVLKLPVEFTVQELCGLGILILLVMVQLVVGCCHIRTVRRGNDMRLYKITWWVSEK